MIWYLLYPLRGTTQPPRLSANHPIRRALYRHGKTTTQHWLVAMLVSVAIAMGFSYPTILLSENPTAGFAAYPHHVWTTAKPFEGDPDRADVEMRQVWVYGSYMKALEKDTLKRALGIQQNLVGSEPLASVMPSLDLYLGTRRCLSRCSLAPRMASQADVRVCSLRVSRSKVTSLVVRR